MFKLYILWSDSRKRYYVGTTGDSLDQRLRKHNTNHKGFTGKTLDWTLLYHEEFESKAEALKREKEIKGWKSTLKIKKLMGA